MNLHAYYTSHESTHLEWERPGNEHSPFAGRKRRVFPVRGMHKLADVILVVTWTVARSLWALVWQVTIKARLSATTRSVHTHRASYRKRETVRFLSSSFHPRVGPLRTLRSPASLSLSLSLSLILQRDPLYSLPFMWMDWCCRPRVRHASLRCVTSRPLPRNPLPSFSPLFYGFHPLPPPPLPSHVRLSSSPTVVDGNTRSTDRPAKPW